MDDNTVESIAKLAKDAAGSTILNVATNDLSHGLPARVPVLFDYRPDGGGLKSLRDEVERWRIEPERRKGTAKATTLRSFIDLVLYHKDEASVLFANTMWPLPRLLAVIDYHQGQSPRHMEHRIVYDFPLTDEFKDWIGHDAKLFTQAEFAAFIEDHAVDLASPLQAEKSEFEALFRGTFAPPNVMVVLSRGLQVNVDCVVKNHVVLQSGEGEINFVEEHLDKKGEKLQVPSLFMVSVAPFVGGEPVRLPARLRYRVSGGKVTWLYQLYRWKEWLRERVTADLALVADEANIIAIEGSPEA